jgi:tetratricopeptide (TPR) repeat protein
MATAELTALVVEAGSALQAPADATVVGERVKVLAVELQGNERRGLVARIERRGVTHVISLADLEVARSSPLHGVVERYRALLGMSYPAQPGPSPREHAAPSADLEPGARVDAVVLAVKTNAVRCRLVEGGVTFTLRASGRRAVVPGELATVRVSKTWRYAGHPYASGELERSRLEVARLGLVPLRLEPHDDWDPADEEWGEPGERVPEWARAIVARGRRPRFELEQVIPGADPSAWDTDPIVEAAERRESGDEAGARALLMEQLAADLRCLDAHAHLGNLEFDRWPEVALRHYEAGVRIGELSLGEGFEGLLPWTLVDNRPFLRCLHGYGLCLWRLGQPDAARAVFERMLWLNPSDNQGARFLLEDVRRRTWEEMQEREAQAPARGSSRAGRGRAAAEREISVDLQELAFALEDGEAGHTWYLDRETGALHLVSDELDDDELPVSREELEDDPRFAAVEPEEPGRAHRDMEEFAANVKDRGLRVRLEDALRGKGAFGRFKRVLAERPAERERWFAFRNGLLEERAREWLESVGVKVRR